MAQFLLSALSHVFHKVINNYKLYAATDNDTQELSPKSVYMATNGIIKQTHILSKEDQLNNNHREKQPTKSILNTPKQQIKDSITENNIIQLFRNWFNQPLWLAPNVTEILTKIYTRLGYTNIKVSDITQQQNYIQFKVTYDDNKYIEYKFDYTKQSIENFLQDIIIKLKSKKTVRINPIVDIRQIPKTNEKTKKTKKPNKNKKKQHKTNNIKIKNNVYYIN